MMIRAARPLLALALASAVITPALGQTAAPAAAPAASGTRVVLAGGTSISVVVADKISSANANVGDTFAIRAAADVVVNGWVAVAKGSTGEGEIVSVDRAGSHGHPGTLGVQMDWIYAVDGNKVKLTSQKRTEEGQGEAGKSSTVTILSWAFLGLPGLFAHNFVKGHDVVIDDTHPLTAYIDESVYVVATSQGDAAPGFAPAAVAGDGNAPAVDAHTIAAASTAPAAGMAPAAPDTYAPRVDPASAAPAATGGASTVLELSGAGNQTTKTFSVNGAWAIAWSYDCASAPKSSQTFQMSVQGGGAQTPIQPSGPSGIDITHYHAQGTYYLAIETGCTWHIKVFNEST